jgi:crotonobetaine/carnitine-CoA ligase
VQTLVAGATLVIGQRFSASGFWGDVAAAEATITYLLGAIVDILMRQPSGDHDRSHNLRTALAPSTTANLAEGFFDRFGVRLVDAYGSTETNFVLGAPLTAQRPGYMGQVIDGFDAKVVDQADNAVPDGTPGELILRPHEPFSFSTGYFEQPDKTVEAWRNLWFHTGDRVVREPDGYFRFIDRLTDSIRRRGENFSSYEVEQAVLSHPEVSAAAVFPVRSELGDDEVMACVVLKGSPVDPVDLIRHCELQLAYFALPRYLDFVTELPLTETGKVQKTALRERGVTATTWDRVAVGYVIER